MSEVRRWAHTVEWEGLQISATYMAINDGGEYVMHDDYAALEAELAKLRAGQEPVAMLCEDVSEFGTVEYFEVLKRIEPGTKLYTAPQPSSVPDGFLIIPIQPTEGMRKRAQDYLAAEGMIVSDWLVHTAYTEMLAAAPSAPATVTVQGVNQQLLEVLENTATWIEQLPVPTAGAAGQLVKIDKAIAAARQEGGKV